MNKEDLLKEIKGTILETVNEAKKKTSARETAKKVVDAFGGKLPEPTKTGDSENLEKIAKKLGMSEPAVRRALRDAREMEIGVVKESFVRQGDLKGLVNWLESPENWEAAANAVGVSGKEDDLVNFVKAHREFSDWSWGDVKDAIDQANEMNLMESLKLFYGKNKLLNEIKKTIKDGFDRGDAELHKSVTSDTNLETLRDKIKRSKNPKLIDTFALVAQKYKDKLTNPKNFSVIDRAIDQAAKKDSWNELENWFVTQVAKTQQNKPLQEFIVK